MADPAYPTSAEIDDWCGELLARADATDYAVKTLDDASYTFQLAVRHTAGNTYVAFSSDQFATFYGYWQPVPGGGPAPALVHLPGYGSELSAHPELVAAGFNVLHVNPQGHGTPTGPDENKHKRGDWPVLPETIESLGARGYVDWLRDVLVAVRWLVSQPSVQANRLGFLGTSQGGGGALLVASILRARGVKAVAADLPFLTDYRWMAKHGDSGAYALAFHALDRVAKRNADEVPRAWRALGTVDTLSHAHRLTLPVMLTAGTDDAVTPARTVRSLFEALPATRSYTELAGQGHAYTPPFLRLAAAWFGYYL